jgi:hypothetical protein
MEQIQLLYSSVALRCWVALCVNYWSTVRDLAAAAVLSGSYLTQGVLVAAITLRSVGAGAWAPLPVAATAVTGPSGMAPGCSRKLPTGNCVPTVNRIVLDNKVSRADADTCS